jgi:hypothetical protein
MVYIRRRKHFYRVRLVAYDRLPTSHWHLPSRIPSPSPTPLALITHRRKSPFSKIHLTKMAVTHINAVRFLNG